MIARAGYHELNAGKGSRVEDDHAALRAGSIGKSTLPQGLSHDEDAGSAGAPPLFAGGASWEDIAEEEHEAERREAAREDDGEVTEPENSGAISRLDAGESTPEGGESAEAAEGDGPAPEALGAAEPDAQEEEEHAATAMPSDAMQVGPDPARAADAGDSAHDEDHDEDHAEGHGEHAAALAAAAPEDKRDDDEDGAPAAAAQAAKDDDADDDDADDDDAGAGARAAAAPASLKSTGGGKGGGKQAGKGGGSKKTGAKTSSKKKGGKQKPKGKPHHRGKYERTVKKASGYDPERDGLNRRTVRSYRPDPRDKDKKQIGRPGLRVGKRDEFHINGDYAYRYMIKSGNVAEVVDMVWERDLQPDGSNDKKKARLALNPSAVRTLTIGTEKLECIMSWNGGQSAAWIAIKDIKGASAGAIKAASKRRANWRPMGASKQERANATEMKFRPVTDAYAKKDHIDEKRYVVPGQTGGANKIGDYLGKSANLRRLGTSIPATAAGESKRLEAKNNNQRIAVGQSREVYNVAMNLPHDRTPPVALDVAHPQDSFFVPKSKEKKKFRREISLYRPDADRSRVRQTWVFGYVHSEEGGVRVPDLKRRGWVPLRVLQ